MKGYLKEKMTYKRMLEKKRHLLTDNCELCDNTWGAPVTGQDELWCVHPVLRFFHPIFYCKHLYWAMKVSCRAKFKFKAAVPAFLGKVEIRLNLIDNKNHSGIKCKKTLHWYELCSIWKVNASNKKNAKFSCDTCMEELPNHDYM